MRIPEAMVVVVIWIQRQSLLIKIVIDYGWLRVIIDELNLCNGLIQKRWVNKSQSEES